MFSVTEMSMSTPQPAKSSSILASSLLHSAPPPKHRTLKQEIDEELSDAEFDEVLEEVRQKERNRCNVGNKLADDTYYSPNSDDDEASESIISVDITNDSHVGSADTSSSDVDNSVSDCKESDSSALNLMSPMSSVKITTAESSELDVQSTEDVHSVDIKLKD